MMTELMNSKLTQDQITTEVQRYWQAFSRFDVKTLRRMYGHDASVIHPSSRKHELGALTVARYEREYADPACEIRIQLGEIHVSLLGEAANAAVATYSFEGHYKNVSTIAGFIDRHVTYGRATQVFAYDSDGNLKIMHEHRSEAAKPGKASTRPETIFKDLKQIRYQ